MDMDIAPAILRLKPEPDVSQMQVIGHAEGPMLVIAGPGSGKTHTIQPRAVNLLLTAQTKPGELVLCTFGRNAAWQLQRRFESSALACGFTGDIKEAQVTTIHSLCRRLLDSRAAMVGLQWDYRVLNEEEQLLLLSQESDAVFGPDRDILSRRGWRDGVYAVTEAARYFDRICDELIDVGVLAGARQPFIAALGRSCQRYRQLLLRHNAVDFAHLQVWAHRVLQEDHIAAAARAVIRHLMVDEFQDTSRVQMRILERLAGIGGNIVAVGDDDQSVYRFRGASVSNLLEFSGRFPECRVAELTTNYRSHRDIVGAVNQWMDHGSPVGSRRPLVPLHQGHRAQQTRRPPRLSRRHLGPGAGPYARGEAAGGTAPVPETQRRHRQVRAGGSAPPQRQGRGERPVPGRPGTGRYSGPLRASGARPSIWG